MHPFLKFKKENIKLSLAVKIIAAVLFTVGLLTMLPAAIPDSEVDMSEATLPFDDQIPDNGAVANPNEFPHIVIVYPEADAWGAEEATHVKAHLSSRFHAHFVLISDSDYLALDSDTLSLYNAEPSLTLNLGITRLLEETYIEIISKLGKDGLEIKRTGNRIDITSATPERINEGVLAFSEALCYDGGLVIAEDLYICDARPSAETDLSPDIISDGETKILTLSYIDTNPYTLRAIEGLVGAVKPDLVVFNGYVDGGTSTRRDLSELWQSISEILAKTETPWCFTPGILTGGLPRITVCEVISSFPGCIRPIDGEKSFGYSLTVASSKGSILASIYIADTADSAALAAQIEADTALYERANEKDRKIIPILPAISPEMISEENGLPEDKVVPLLSDIYAALRKAGAEEFICAGSSVSPAIVKNESGTIYFCGSVGFDSQGIGGRFDYNHSLRCGLIMTLGIEGSAISCIYAAELGLNER